jgi:hypothetical protein
MLLEFLRSSKSARRLGFLTSPCENAFNLIRHVGGLNHIIFPLLPNKVGYLTHLMVESKCDAFIVGNSVDSKTLEDAKITHRSLGIPLFNNVIAPLASYPASLPTGSLILANQPLDSSIPSTIVPTDFDSHVIRNKALMQEIQGTVLPWSRNWILDACSFDCVFVSRPPVAPAVLIVEPATATEALASIKAGSVSTENLERIVLDVPLAYESACILTTELEKLLTSLDRPVFLRYVDPETGPIGELVALADSRDLSNSKFAPLREPPVEARERRAKRRIMAPDWRVRKVPISVYHKKRGFKGQIYYTTKHKGWSFYRSRY